MSFICGGVDDVVCLDIWSYKDGCICDFCVGMFGDKYDKYIVIVCVYDCVVGCGWLL